MLQAHPGCNIHHRYGEYTGGQLLAQLVCWELLGVWGCHALRWGAAA